MNTIEMNHRNNLPGDTVVERGEGEFLVLDRFFSQSYSDANGRNLTLVYNVQQVLTPKEFYELLGMRSCGVCLADDISDHLVKAFDSDMAGDLGFASALFAYRAPDGRIMHQHST